MQGQQPFYELKKGSRKGVYDSLSPKMVVSPQVYVAIDPLFETGKHATTREVGLAEQSRFIGQREAKSPDRLKVDSTVNSIMPPTCMDVVSANPQPATTPEGGKKVASRRNEKMRHHAVRRFLRSHHWRGEPAAAFGDCNPPTLESGDAVVDKVKGQGIKRQSGRKAKPNLNKVLRAMMAEMAPSTSSNIEGETNAIKPCSPTTILNSMIHY